MEQRHDVEAAVAGCQPERAANVAGEAVSAWLRERLGRDGSRYVRWRVTFLRPDCQVPVSEPLRFRAGAAHRALPAARGRPSG